MAPLENPVEVFRKESTLNRDQSIKKDWFFNLINNTKTSYL